MSNALRCVLDQLPMAPTMSDDLEMDEQETADYLELLDDVIRECSDRHTKAQATLRERQAKRTDRELLADLYRQVIRDLPVTDISPPISRATLNAIAARLAE